MILFILFYFKEKMINHFRQSYEYNLPGKAPHRDGTLRPLGYGPYPCALDFEPEHYYYFLNTETENEFTYGDVITGSYPMTASITRELMTTAGSRKTGIDSETGGTFKTGPIYPHYYALKNRLEHLTLRSAQFRITGSVTGSTYA